MTRDGDRDRGRRPTSTAPPGTGTSGSTPWATSARSSARALRPPQDADVAALASSAGHGGEQHRPVRRPGGVQLREARASAAQPELLDAAELRRPPGGSKIDGRGRRGGRRVSHQVLGALRPTRGDHGRACRSSARSARGPGRRPAWSVMLVAGFHVYRLRPTSPRPGAVPRRAVRARRRHPACARAGDRRKLDLDLLASRRGTAAPGPPVPPWPPRHLFSEALALDPSERRRKWRFPASRHWKDARAAPWRPPPLPATAIRAARSTGSAWGRLAGLLALAHPAVEEADLRREPSPGLRRPAPPGARPVSSRTRAGPSSRQGEQQVPAGRGGSPGATRRGKPFASGRSRAPPCARSASCARSPGKPTVEFVGQEVQDPRGRPPDRQVSSTAARSRARVPGGEPVVGVQTLHVLGRPRTGQRPSCGPGRSGPPLLTVAPLVEGDPRVVGHCGAGRPTCGRPPGSPSAHSQPSGVLCGPRGVGLGREGLEGPWTAVTTVTRRFTAASTTFSRRVVKSSSVRSPGSGDVGDDRPPALDVVRGLAEQDHAMPGGRSSAADSSVSAGGPSGAPPRGPVHAYHGAESVRQVLRPARASLASSRRVGIGRDHVLAQEVGGHQVERGG